MGVDIHVYILHKTNDGYEELKLYKLEDGKLANIYPSYEDRNYALFDVLADAGRGRGEDCGALVSPRGIFEEAPQFVKDKYNETYFYDATYYDWTELNAWAETSKVMVPHYDFESDDEEVKITRYNVLQPWLNDISFVLNAYGLWYPKPGEIVIQVWFDC